MTSNQRRRTTTIAVLIAAACVVSTWSTPAQGLDALSIDQIDEAIALGKAGNVPIVKISKFGGDYDMYISGPVARIAAAANAATKLYKPFTSDDVINRDIIAPFYSFRVMRAMRMDTAFVTNVVLQPKGAKGMDGVIQPLKERFRTGDYRFDRLPDGDFQIVVVGGKGDDVQKYGVGAKDRARIR